MVTDLTGRDPGIVNLASSLDSQVVGQQLHGDDGQDALESVHTPGHLQSMLGPLGRLLISLLHNQDWLAITSSHLVVGMLR